MYCQLVTIIFVLVISAGRLSSQEFDGTPLEFRAMNNDQLKKICGVPNVTDNRIVGGINATLNAWPWMAAIFFRESFKSVVCGGALINDKFVLTAAHCVATRSALENAKDYTIRLGDLDILSNNDGAKPEDFKVTKFIKHEGYNDTSMENDIALIELDRIVKFSPSILPVCLPDSPDLINSTMEKAEPIVTGWGLLSDGGLPSSMMQQVTLNVIDLTKCRVLTNSTLTENQLCAGNEGGGKDSCQGDSGGPMMVLNSEKKQNVIGVVSFGHGCALPNQPGIYTRVNKYLDWIKKNAGIA